MNERFVAVSTVTGFRIRVCFSDSELRSVENVLRI